MEYRSIAYGVLQYYMQSTGSIWQFKAQNSTPMTHKQQG